MEPLKYAKFQTLASRCVIADEEAPILHIALCVTVSDAERGDRFNVNLKCLRW